MEKKITILDSFEEADRLDKEYYRGLSPKERLAILLELNQRWPARQDGKASEGLARVYRIVELA
jgi:hypothetical protein